MSQDPTNEPPDSDDLSYEEIVHSIVVKTRENLVNHLKGIVCASCQEALTPTFHELRRRSPKLYWRITLRCKNDHTTKVVFQPVWLR